MKNTQLILSFLAVFLIAGVFSCGNNTADRNYTLSTGFYVVSSQPANQQYNVSTDQSLVITFSLPVNQTSLNDSDNFKVESWGQGTLSAKTEVTGFIEITGNGETVVFRPNLPNYRWEADMAYVATLNYTLTSMSGQQLNSGTTIMFVTSDTNYFGQINEPGVNPYIKYFEVVPNTPWGDNLAFLIEFNEDIIQQPFAYVELKLYGEISVGVYTLIVWPAFSNSLRYYYLLFNDCGCAADLYSIGMHLQVHVQDAYDIDWERLVHETKSFTYLSDYYGSACTPACF